MALTCTHFAVPLAFGDLNRGLDAQMLSKSGFVSVLFPALGVKNPILLHHFHLGCQVLATLARVSSQIPGCILMHMWDIISSGETHLTFDSKGADA